MDDSMREDLDISPVEADEPRGDHYSCSSTSEQIYTRHDEELSEETKLDISKLPPPGMPIKSAFH